ncbi:MAG: Trk system potassium transporter TrkA [Haliea sp.]|nr:Trk system potassium transporter TrkA [Haliea sp.]|tara:strand:- start:117440 stop:118816 length:1377 start_codon:yes stop_codon:yes gene_type:complete
MRIVILGAGQVGGSLAEYLVGEGNDVTVVDCDNPRLQALQDKFDLRVVCGQASHPRVLRQAGVDDVDMLVAVTSSDEINMVACQVARRLFRVPKTIARVRESDYLAQEDALFGPEGFPVDVLISPEALVTRRLEHLLTYAGALQVLDFAQGRVQLVAVRAGYGGALVGREIAEQRRLAPGRDARVVAIFRRDRALMPRGDTVVEEGDEVFFISSRQDSREIMHLMRPQDRPYRRVMIAGGGNIGARLAGDIQAQFRVKVVECSLPRCEVLSQQLRQTTVLHGEATDPDLLTEEGIAGIDAFLAVTNDDEANIMASMLAARLGARTVITLINNRVYVDLIQGGPIDIAISPQQSTIGALLTYVRRGDVVAVHALRRGAAEAIEAVAHGDRDSSRVVGRRIGELALPAGTLLGAIIRGEEVMVAHDDVEIAAEDHVILFVADKRAVKQVEKLFQVGLGFF